MMRFTVEHKYCKCTREIEGYNVWDAYKTNGLDLNVWIVINVEKAWKKEGESSPSFFVKFDRTLIYALVW